METPLSIYLFNVGAGDNVLIEFPNGEFGIVDFYYNVKYNQALPPAISLLQNRISEGGKVTIAFVCISHYDSDHIKGFEEFWQFISDNNIIVKDVWLAGAKDVDHFKETALFKVSNAIWADTSIDSSIKKRLEKYDTRFSNIMDKINIWKKNTGSKAFFVQGVGPVHEKLPNDFTAFSIAPLFDHVEAYNSQNLVALIKTILYTEEISSSSDRNSISSIIYLQHKDFRLTFGGDAPTKLWLDGLQEASKRTNYKLSSNFVKVSHHGSKNSSNIEIWNKLNEQRASFVVAVSAGTKYQHPDSETIQDIDESCISKGIPYKVYATNFCQQCLDLHDIPSQECNLIRKHTGTIVDLQLQRCRSPFYKRSGSSKGGLLAYKFDFFLSNETSKISILTDIDILPNVQCKFKNHLYKPRNECSAY